MTYEELQKVNATLETTDIKGKPYISVNERIKAFRQLCPDGFIRTTPPSMQDGECVSYAEVGEYVITADGKVEEKILGTGSAHEKENSSYINKTSYVENCETSAVGRALAMLGIGINTSVASYEEVDLAIAQQEIQKASDKANDKETIERKIQTLVTYGKDEAKIREALEKEKDKGKALDKWLSAIAKEAPSEYKRS